MAQYDIWMEAETDIACLWSAISMLKHYQKGDANKWTTDHQEQWEGVADSPIITLDVLYNLAQLMKKRSDIRCGR